MSRPALRFCNADLAFCHVLMVLCKEVSPIINRLFAIRPGVRNTRDVVRRMLTRFGSCSDEHAIDLGIPFVEPPASLTTWNLLS